MSPVKRLFRAITRQTQSQTQTPRSVSSSNNNDNKENNESSLLLSDSTAGLPLYNTTHTNTQQQTLTDNPNDIVINMAAVPNNHPADITPSSSTKKSKTQKVLSVAKRPLRTVGRIVGKGKRHHHHHQNYGSTGDEDDDDDDEEDLLLVDDEEVLMGDGDSSQVGLRRVVDAIPGDANKTTPERQGSFMERVNSYRAAATDDLSISRRHEGIVVDSRDWIVLKAERTLRMALLVLLAFNIGTYKAEWRSVVQRLCEYVAVAWITCCVLWIVSATTEPPPAVRPRRVARRRVEAVPETVEEEAEEERQRRKSLKESETEKEKAVVATEEMAAVAEQQPTNDLLLKQAPSDEELAALIPAKVEEEVPAVPASTEKQQVSPTKAGGAAKHRRKSSQLSKKLDSSVKENGEKLDTAAEQPEVFTNTHPALDPFYCINKTNGARVAVNSSEPHVLDNDWFKGHMILMIRTPDVDDPSKPKGNTDNEVVKNYMKEKLRRFEFQYQIKLKKVPEGQKIYFAGELDEAVKMGMIQRAFVGAAMAFMKKTNGSFQYSMTGSKEDPDGRWEKPHMSFPVEMSMDRVVVTKPGETPPKLGTIIEEDPEHFKNRKKGGTIDWNMEDTYTLALWTSYVDFIDWRVINLPGIRPFELTKVIGPQPILLTLYLIPKERAAEKHYRRDITSVVELELCNTNAGLLGPYAKQWAGKHNQQAMLRSQSADTNDLDQSEEDEVSEEEASEEEPSEDEGEAQFEEDEELGGTAGESSARDEALLDDETEYDATEAATAAELGEGMYLRSGDHLVLKESGLDDENAGPCFVTNGAGFAVLREGVSSSSTIVLQKARKHRHSSRARNELIKSGDTVSVKLVTKGAVKDEVRYLSIHRGWWLKWVSTPPSRNGFFTIFTHETEFSEHDPSEIRTGETQSAYLTFGGSFWLRHKRWSQYSVGVAAEGSATYGGRVLGLFQPRSGEIPSNEMDPNDEDMPQPDSDGKSSKKRWMRMLQLRAYEASQPSLASGLAIPKTVSEEQTLDDIPSPEKPKLIFSEEDSRLDVPAWIEVMNRTERIRQLTYAVRVAPRTKASTPSASANSDEENPVEGPPTPETPKSYIRLRTGRDLAEIMRVGLSWRSTSGVPPEKKKMPTPVR